MKPGGRHYRLAWRAAVPLVALGLAVTGVVAARAAHGSHASAASTLTPDKKKPKPTPTPTYPPGPGMPPLPSGAFDQAAAANNESSDRKADTLLKLPQLHLRLYITFVSSPGPAESIDAYIIDPPATGSTTLTYGTVPDLAPVTTLAFGAIPVTIQLSISQPRTSTGLIQPLHLVANFAANTGTLTGQLQVAVRSLSIDGLNLPIGASCRTVTPATISALGKPPSYSAGAGGPLFGTVTIPDWTGCHNGSEDLDALLNGTVSGTANNTNLTQGGFGPFNPNLPPLYCDPLAGVATSCSSPLPVATPTPTVP